jgi:hypothetical protein
LDVLTDTATHKPARASEPTTRIRFIGASLGHFEEPIRERATRNPPVTAMVGSLVARQNRFLGMAV